MLLAACTSSTQGAGTPLTTPGPQTTAGQTTGSSSTAASSTGTTSSTASPTTSPSGAPGQDAAHALLAHLTEAQRVGQLFMVDCPSTSVATATVQAIQQYHVGSVILDGNSYLSVDQTRALTATLENANPSPAKLFVSTDQEGGLVRRLRGPGFSSLPSAVDQATLAPSALQADWQLWGSQLRAAGVNVDLAPVLDTVPPGAANPPIGDLDRQYGADPASVQRAGTAVLRGLAAARVDATVKHFPGLGRVTGNTDTTSGVTDTVTTRNDPYLAPFAAAVRGGVPLVMISTAIYARIDPDRPAAFSPTVITGMLRGDLGFTGVVISDDLGNAAQVGGYSPSDRATAFIGAGGDIVLTVNPGQIAAMSQAVLGRASSNVAFRNQVDAAALRVLEAKAALGLLG
jgi:beta-N-acetylhexosaminidase